MAGTVISADFQTDGRGQYGKLWHSEARANLLLSVLLRPAFLKPTDSFLLNIAASVSVCQLLEKYLPERMDDIRIKWPNDVLVKNRKICGLLIQNSFYKDRIQHSVVGLGLNVNQTDFGPDSYNAAPTSMAIEGRDNFDRRTLLSDFVDRLKNNMVTAEKYSGQLRDQYLKLLTGNRKPVLLINKEDPIRKMEVRVLSIRNSGVVLVNDGKVEKWISVNDWTINL